MKFERLGEKITQVRGISYKPNEISAIPTPDYVPILKANNIQEDGIDTSDLIYIHKSKVKPEQFIRKGDLLLAASSGSKEIVGKNIYFESDFDGSFGAFCKLVRPKKNINPRYLATFFKSVSYKRHIKKLLSGALINNLKNEYIDSLLIPELSDSDQHHIANILSKAENLIAQRKESIRLLDEFLKSTFLEMFGDPVRNEKGWGTKIFGEFTERITKGESPKWQGFNYLDFGVRFITSENVLWGSVDLQKAKFIHEDFHKKLKRSQLQENDLLVNLVGASVGRSSLCPKEALPANINQAVAAITLNLELINEVYALHLFINPSFQRMLLGNVVEAARANLSLSDLRNLKFPTPPIELQNQFAQIVEKTEALKSQYQHSLNELENLYGSLSQKAFRGELSRK